jgi:excinuclease UvrABC nuclease subunit
LSGENTVGVMTVVEDGMVNKNEYRKFKINKSIQNDIACLKEILERRFTHNEWTLPQIIVVDGGKAQINIARKDVKKLISEREIIESEINHFVNITTDFEVRDKRMAIIRDRGLCERYE